MNEPSAVGAPLLEARQLSVSRDGRKVLDQVSLHVGASEVLSIVGPSGSGKSSLLYALAGLIPVTGTVRSTEPIGVVFQDHGVFPWRTVEGNVEFGIRSLPKAQRRSVVTRLLSICGLSELRSRYPQQLSGGQRQRVAVARTLATSAKLLLLDEPFASLDIVTRIGLRSWLRGLVDELGVSIILVTHDIDDALTLSNRIMVLADRGFKLEIEGLRARERMSTERASADTEGLRRQLVEVMTERRTIESDISEYTRSRPHE